MFVPNPHIHTATPKEGIFQKTLKKMLYGRQ